MSSLSADPVAAAMHAGIPSASMSVAGSASKTGVFVRSFVQEPSSFGEEDAKPSKHDAREGTTGRMMTSGGGEARKRPSEQEVGEGLTGGRMAGCGGEARWRPCKHKAGEGPTGGTAGGWLAAEEKLVGGRARTRQGESAMVTSRTLGGRRWRLL
ncbi:Os10g0484500 [Oryza sativa Japonica Group]|uniref:Os10g0484500 protein n=1 Tax=Oryza sativa subsp. japonica TaxID=39947 RepID=A0A0P0XW46_ORYSJ|nr:Os10g0484500 [Oryza sativa Japonica Group]